MRNQQSEVARAYGPKMVAKIEALQAAKSMQLELKNDLVGKIRQPKSPSYVSDPTPERLHRSGNPINQTSNGARVGPLLFKPEVLPPNHSVVTRPTLFQKSCTKSEMMDFAKYCMAKDIASGRFVASQFKEGSGKGKRTGGGIPFTGDQQEALRWLSFVTNSQYKLPANFIGCLDQLWLNWVGKGKKEFLNGIGKALVTSTDIRKIQGASVGYYRAVSHALRQCDANYIAVNTGKKQRINEVEMGV